MKKYEVCFNDKHGKNYKITVRANYFRHIGRANGTYELQFKQFKCASEPHENDPTVLFVSGDEILYVRMVN